MISGTSGASGAAYKLTMKDANISVAVTGGSSISRSGTTITVPYTISGTNAGYATQVSVVITDSAWTLGTPVTSGYTYLKLTVDTFGTTGTGTFTLPAAYADQTCGTDYYAYIVAEDVNVGNATDYASVPVSVTIPAASTGSSSFGHTITVTNDGHGTGSPDHSTASNDAIICLSSTPSQGYIFDRWTTDDNIRIINPTSSDAAWFRMIDSDVTVKANFIADPAFSSPGSAPSQATSEPDPPVNYMQEVEDKITSAIALGGSQTVRIEGYPALSYHVLEMLKDHPDITLVSEFTYEGLEYRITIPGSAVILDPSINWYGPKYLFPMYYKYGTDTLLAVQAYLDKYESPAS